MGSHWEPGKVINFAFPGILILLTLFPPPHTSIQTLPFHSPGDRVMHSPTNAFVRRYFGDRVMQMVRVSGRHRGDIRLYALSTCGWCAKTKELLNTLGVEYSYVFVDLLPQEELEGALSEVEKYNPAGSFPTLVIDGSRVIVGFREAEIREVLK
jgi:glutaredoxin